MTPHDSLQSDAKHLAELAALREDCQEARRDFLDRHGEDLEHYRHEISAGFGEALRRFQQDVATISGDHPLCRRLAAQTARYVEWLQWALWDLPAFAVALRPEPERFRKSVTACGLVYISFRLLDDLIDRHFHYRGQTTFLAEFTADDGRGRVSEGLVTLSAVLLSFEGLMRLGETLESDEGRLASDAVQTLREVIQAARRTLIGAMLEGASPETWDAAYYDRLIRLKNVDYWRLLWAALDPAKTSPLFPFLSDYYLLAQKINDVQDYPEDEARGQPNLITLERRRDVDEPLRDRIVRILTQDLLALGERARDLPEPERQVAFTKLAETLEEVERVEGFIRGETGSDKTGSDRAESGKTESSKTESMDAESSKTESMDAESGDAAPGTSEPIEPAPLDISWASNLDEIIVKLGMEALDDPACPVCETKARTHLFRKQGFAFHRCQECDHIYVAPRLRSDLQARLSAEGDGQATDPFLETGKIYADFVCRLLRQRSAGRRLLDVGFGHGYLLQLAQVHGFEVYGVEDSKAAIERLRPSLGRRLHRGRLGDGELPWGSFDAIVLSHVLEHVAEPRQALESVKRSLQSGGWLYIAVPDMASMQYRVFGKAWEAIHPLVHYQYFAEETLGRLLRDLGFEQIEVVKHPPFQPKRAKPWQRLFRRLDGNESGELAMLARKPVENETARELSTANESP